MTDSLDELKTELHDHEYNREQGVARLSTIDESERVDSEIYLEFSLPRGGITFTKTCPDSDAVWDTLYGLSDATPPCVDDLIGTEVPITWDEADAEWTLDVEIPDPACGPTPAPDSDLSETSTEWADRVTTAHVIGTLISGVCALLAGAVYASNGLGSAQFLGLTAVVILIGWAFVFGYSSTALRRLYTGEYEWARP